MKQSTISPQYVDFIPDKLSEGILYICERYHTAAHKCCCGCGEEVITPLTRVDWSIKKDGDAVSLHPSIGNWSFACQSHYWIRKNQIVWAKGMSKQEIERVRKRDREDKEAYIAAQNLSKAQAKITTHILAIRVASAIRQLWQAAMRWWST